MSRVLASAGCGHEPGAGMSPLVGQHNRRLHVLVMAKAPVPGRVKTRLCPPLAPAEAAAVAQAALADTLDAVAACDADYKVVALDGDPGPWLPAGVAVMPQRGRDLAERLANAWADTGAHTSGWGLQIGMDTPQVSPAELNGLLSTLRTERSSPDRRRRAVLGTAEDGGWWVIGLPGTDPSPVFRGIPMSTPSTAAAQRLRLRQLGLHVVAAAPSRDIDTVDDLEVVAGLIPGSRTAAVAGRLLGWPDPAAPASMVA